MVYVNSSKAECKVTITEFDSHHGWVTEKQWGGIRLVHYENHYSATKRYNDNLFAVVIILLRAVNKR